MTVSVLLRCSAGNAVKCEVDHVSTLQQSHKRELAKRAIVEGESTKMEEAFFKKATKVYDTVSEQIDIIAIKESNEEECANASKILTREGCKHARKLLDEVQHGRNPGFYRKPSTKRPAGCYHWSKGKVNKIIWNPVKTPVDRTSAEVKNVDRFAVCKERLTEVELASQCAESNKIVTEHACMKAGELLSRQMVKKIYVDDIWEKSRPAGCYYWEEKTRVVWNDVWTGKAKAGRTPLCKKSQEPNIPPTDDGGQGGR